MWNPSTGTLDVAIFNGSEFDCRIWGAESGRGSHWNQARAGDRDGDGAATDLVAAEPGRQAWVRGFEPREPLRLRALGVVRPREINAGQSYLEQIVLAPFISYRSFGNGTNGKKNGDITDIPIFLLKSVMSPFWFVCPLILYRVRR